MFLYRLIMVLAVTAVFIVLIVAECSAIDAGKVERFYPAENTTMTFNKSIDTLNAQNLALSGADYAGGIRYPGNRGTTFKDLDNNPELITRIEERMCCYLQTIVRLANEAAGGAYFILDATTNTEAPGADWLQNGAVSAERKCGYGRNGESVYHFSAESQMLQEREYPDAQSLESGI